MERLPDLEGIRSFLVVAEDLSFRRAAERLNLDQSALSRRIKDLETRMGVLLFQRTTREVRLTDAGQAFYDSNVQLIDSLRDSMSLARRAAAGVRGRLRVGYMSFAAIATMPRLVRAFREANPEVSVELMYFRTQAQKAELARRSIDVGFMIGPYRNADTHSFLVSEESLVAVVPAAHPIAAQGTCSLAELSERPLILGTMGQWDLYRQMLHATFEAYGLPMNVAFEATDTMGILGLVAAGLGATIFPAGVRRLALVGVAAVEIIDYQQPIQTVLAWRRHEISPVTRKFLSICGVRAQN